MSITGKDAGTEIRKLDDLAKAKEEDNVQVTLLRAIVKGVAVLGKLLISVRGNQVAIMKATPGVELRTPRDRDNKRTSNETEEKGK